MIQKKTKLYLCFMALSVFLISNCGTTVSSVPSPRAFVTQLIENSTPTETRTPTITPTATLSPGGIEYHCINISEEATRLSNIGGTLVLNGFLDPGTKNNPSLLLDMSSGNQFSFTIDYLTDCMVVSPNGDYLAYDVALEPDYRNSQINILASKGKMLTHVVEQDLFDEEWLNDKTLLLNSFNENYEHHPLIFLSPI